MTKLAFSVVPSVVVVHNYMAGAVAALIFF